MAREKEAYPLMMLCRVPGVSRGGFYAFLQRQDRDPDPVNGEARVGSGPGRGVGSHLRARRMARALRALGYRVGRHQARSLMREAGVGVRYRRR
jgi:putative transposase